MYVAVLYSSYGYYRSDLLQVDVHLSMPYDYRAQGSNSHAYQKEIA